MATNVLRCLFIHMVWLLWILGCTYGLKVKGTTITTKNWLFIERFCFKSKDGKLQYTIEYPEKYRTMQLLFYFDRRGSWESVYTSTTMTCEQKVNRTSVASHQRNRLTLGICENFQKNNETWYRCDHETKFVSSRDMWWFFAVSRCNSDIIDLKWKGMYFTYDMHMTNGKEGDILHREFSADEFYILVVDIVCFVLYAGIISISIIVAAKLKDRQLLHSTYKMYMVSLALWWIHLLVYVIAYGSYSQSGYRLDGLVRMGRLISLISIGVFILMLLLLANGFSIVIGRLRKKVTVSVTLIMIFYFLACAVLSLAEARTFDRGLVLYIYDFWPGYCLIAIRMMGWCIFVMYLIFTLRKHKRKRTFYIPFTLLYTLWFWAGPIAILLAVFVMDDWAREKIVHGVEELIMLCGHIFFLILTRPNQASKNFPYTIKTSQIGMVSEHESADRANTYEVTESDHSPVKYEIFRTGSADSSSSGSQETAMA